MSALLSLLHGVSAAVRASTRMGLFDAHGVIVMDEFKFKPEDMAALGWKTCGARTRSGGRCKNLAMFPAGRCRMHGGLSLRGLASPRYKHGRYSKDILAQITNVAAWATAATDEGKPAEPSPLADAPGNLVRE